MSLLRKHLTTQQCRGNYKAAIYRAGHERSHCALSESEAMVAALRKNGTPAWYLMAKDEGHGFVKEKNCDFQFYAAILFMKEYLLK